MNNTTKNRYRQLASNFYSTRLQGVELTPKRITDALIAAATDYRPAYFRRLKNALALDQREKGYNRAADRILATKNPVTAVGSKQQPKPRERRVRRLSDNEYRQLLTTADSQVVAALQIARATGCRPAEMLGIRVDTTTGQVFITGAKKRDQGDRGLDRVLQFDLFTARLLASAVAELQSAVTDAGSPDRAMSRIQNRLHYRAKTLWPRRKSVPSLYTLRHQAGSDLKSSGLDRAAVAYCLGHQSTASVEVYGDRRSGSGSSLIKPGVSNQEISQVVRVNHTMPGQQRSRLKHAPDTGLGL